MQCLQYVHVFYSLISLQKYRVYICDGASKQSPDPENSVSGIPGSATANARTPRFSKF